MVEADGPDAPREVRTYYKTIAPRLAMGTSRFRPLMIRKRKFSRKEH